jgi:hypothetical protein
VTEERSSCGLGTCSLRLCRFGLEEARYFFHTLTLTSFYHTLDTLKPTSMILFAKSNRGFIPFILTTRFPFYFHSLRETDRQTGRQADRQAARQTDSPANMSVAFKMAAHLTGVLQINSHTPCLGFYKYGGRPKYKQTLLSLNQPPIGQPAQKDLSTLRTTQPNPPNQPRNDGTNTALPVDKRQAARPTQRPCP